MKKSTDELLKEVEELSEELNLKSIQNFRLKRGFNGADVTYNTVNKHFQQGKIKGVIIDGTTYLTDRK